MSSRSLRWLLPFALGLAASRLAPSTPAAAPDTPADAQLEQGRSVYGQHCAACHGENGDGNGPATVWLFPRPRNFNAGLFKLQSTPAGSLPTDDDLLRSITRGLAGSSMPAFGYLAEAERRAAVRYVKHLTVEITPDGRRLNRFAEAERTGQAAKPITVPPEPPLTFDSITRGKELYTKLACNTCHGETGAGDGPSAPTLKDAFGIPVPPRDFNTGAFRGGADGRDLYLRLSTGIAGTPMPPFGDDVIKPEERWAVVHFIQSLRRKDIEVSDMLAPDDGRVPVGRTEAALPVDPLDPAWERRDAVRVPLNPLWPEPNPLPAVAVRALHDGRRVAILLQWRDEIANGAPVRVDDFQDAAALQFALTDTTPFLGMGDAAHPVNVWQWKAGWQADVSGAREDVNTIYPSMHVDVYPESGTLFLTAAAAGNLLAGTHTSPIEDANARGFGTMRSQSPDRQNVQGRGLWRDGSWNVVFVRDLASADADDVQFSPDRPVPVAFAVWNGEQRDRNGRKVVSNWFQLALAP